MKKQMETQNRKRGKCSGCIYALFLCAAVLTACGSSAPQAQETTIPPQTTNEDNESPSQTAAEGNASAAESVSQPDDTAENESAPVPEKTSDPGSDKTDGQAAAQVPDDEHNVVELNGTIESIGTGNFVINKIFTETADNGSMIAFSSNEEKTLFNIAYDNQTVFTICTSVDGGITTTNTPGSHADLETGLSALMNGYWEGDTFHAQEITVYHFG